MLCAEMNRKLLVATSKGLVVWDRKGQKEWVVRDVHFQGFPVSVIYADTRHQVWWAGVSHRHWGQKLHRSFDEGKTWDEMPVPAYPDKAEWRPGKAAVLKKVWTISSAGPDKPEGLWVGTEPGGLFYSNDYGQSYTLVESLWNMPGRMDPTQWFGAGRDLPFIHSVVVDPADSDHVYIAVSCAGIFETTDGGATWAAKNKGLIAAYLPDPHAEQGHDPHLLLACTSHPNVLWQQNHCGVFRTENGGQHWSDVSDPGGYVHYGFALAVDESDPLSAWVIPAMSDDQRVPPNLALRVCRTRDGGKTWQSLTSGLPGECCFDIVFRHALARQGSCMAFGSTTGNLFFSDNDGDSWTCLSHVLGRVETVTFA
jgi:ligand-binding sensor domain-containing protein